MYRKEIEPAWTVRQTQMYFNLRTPVTVYRWIAQAKRRPDHPKNVLRSDEFYEVGRKILIYRRAIERLTQSYRETLRKESESATEEVATQ